MAKVFHCKAQFQLARKKQVDLRTENILIITVRPHPTQPNPGNYTLAISRLPMNRMFGMEVLFNQTS